MKKYDKDLSIYLGLVEVERNTVINKPKLEVIERCLLLSANLRNNDISHKITLSDITPNIAVNNDGHRYCFCKVTVIWGTRGEPDKNSTYEVVDGNRDPLNQFAEAIFNHVLCSINNIV